MIQESSPASEIHVPPGFIVELCTTTGRKRWLTDRQVAGLCEHLCGVAFFQDMTDAQWNKVARHLKKTIADQNKSRKKPAPPVSPDQHHPLSHPTSRAPVAKRAGTHLSDSAYPIVVHQLHHGMLDKRNRVYQHGGEAKNFIRWSLKAISIDFDVWTVLRDLVDHLEMVDHVKNQVYVVDYETALIEGSRYTDPTIGDRYAIPLSCWRIFDANGVLIQHAA